MEYKLYDLIADPSQEIDISAERPEVVKRLKREAIGSQCKRHERGT